MDELNNVDLASLSLSELESLLSKLSKDFYYNTKPLREEMYKRIQDQNNDLKKAS